MDIDAAISRYLDNPQVSNWLFSSDEIRSVTLQALDACFVYAIGFGTLDPTIPQAMNIEDMLIVRGTVGTFVLGVVWGLSQPHVFASTPLMKNNKPLSRRFAIDLSARNCLEFMEFISFADGKTVVMFRQFLHTLDQSLPVVACARLHAASTLYHTLGAIVMRADLFEASSCPVCGFIGSKCSCTFESYAPNATISKSTYTWNHFTSQFLRKSRVGVVKWQMTAVLPSVGEMRIMDHEISVINICQKGQTEYMTLLRRKAVHGLGVNVTMPRTDSHVLALSLENDFLDLHNSYISRKRIHERNIIPQSQSDTPQISDDVVISVNATPVGAKSIDSINDMDQVFPGMLQTANSSTPDDAAGKRALDVINSAKKIPYSLEDFQILDENSSNSFLQYFLHSNPSSSVPCNSPPASDKEDPRKNILETIDDIIAPNVTKVQEVDQVQETSEFPIRNAISSSLVERDRNSPRLTSSECSEESKCSTRKEKQEQVTKKLRPGETLPIPESQVASVDKGMGLEKKHTCSTCPARFKMRGDLLRHVRNVHEGKRMYHCQTCGKSFGHSGHLNRHIQSVHLRQRRFKCQFCGFQFTQASHLQSHISHIHSANRPFQCKGCGLRVSTHSALRSHKKQSKCSYQCEVPPCGGRAIGD